MLKDMKAAIGTAGTAEEKSNKSSLGHVMSTWSRKAVLAGMILTSTLVAENTFSAASSIVASTAAQTVPIGQRKSSVSQELAGRLASAKGVGISIGGKEVLVKFRGKTAEGIPRSEFNEATRQLKRSGAAGIIKVYFSELPEKGSRRLQIDLKNEGKDGILIIHSEKKNLGKILDLERTDFSLNEAMKFFREGKCDKPVCFDYSNYPKEAMDYVENLGRKHYKSSLLRIFVPSDADTMNEGITAEQRGRFQALASKIVMSEYGDRQVTPEEAAIAINRWISNNINYEGKTGIPALRTFKSAIAVISLGRGTCTDMADLLDALCNSIGVPARMIFIGNNSNWRNKWVGGGFHTVTEIYLEGKGWVVFDPTNRCYVTDEYYTRATYFRVLPMLMDKINPEDIIWNVSKPIKN